MNAIPYNFTTSKCYFNIAPPQWKIEPKDLLTQEGETGSIECQAQGVPAPRITWTFGTYNLYSNLSFLSYLGV